MNWGTSKTVRRSAVALTMTGLMLAGCAEPSGPYPYNPYAPYPNGAVPAPQVTPSYQGWPTAPQEAPPADLPAAAPEESLPWTEPPLSQPANPLPTQTNPADMTPQAVPGAAMTVPPSGGDSRLNSLKSNLEKATPGSASRSASASAAGCTHVHQRTGFHDHYGGLNSAGDVLQTCAPPTSSK